MESSSLPLFLAAFGKHPGWNDHIPPIGVETETLAYVYQTLYEDGIRGQIDSGAWEKLEPGKREEGFDHMFLWLSGGHGVLGRLWSSSDRAGRSKYPMVLCVESGFAASGFVLAEMLVELERLRGACKTTASEDQVRVECRAAGDRLQSQFGALKPGELPTAVSLEFRRRFLEHHDLGSARLGLLRVLHELGSASSGSASGHVSPPRPQAGVSTRLRVPLASETQLQSLQCWAAFLECAVPGAWPLLLIARTGAKWLDIIVGEPAGGDFFCLQASNQALPLTTEIPYELSPLLQQRLQELEARFLGQEPPATAFPKALTPVAVAAQRDGNPSIVTPPHHRWKWTLILGVILAALIAVAGFWPVDGVRLGSLLANKLSQAISPAPLASTDKTNSVTATEPNAGSQSESALKAANEKEALERQKYAAALKDAQAAFDRKDYSNALVKAETLLAINPDAAAVGLKAAAQHELDLLAAAEQAAKLHQQKNERAIIAPTVALGQTNHPDATNHASPALEPKPGDPTARSLTNPPQTVVVSGSTKPGAPASPDAGRVANETPPMPPQSGSTSTLAMSNRAWKTFTNDLNMEFVWVSTLGGGGGFVGKYEVTQKQFLMVMRRLPEGQPVLDDDLPVANVPFDAAKDFCGRLSAQENQRYSLPSKEDWLAIAGLSPAQIQDAWKILTGRGDLEKEVTSWKINPPLARPAHGGSRGTQTNGVCDLFGNVREWVVEKESAGFAYNTGNNGTNKSLFLAGKSAKALLPVTGFRCLLRKGE